MAVTGIMVMCRGKTIGKPLENGGLHSGKLTACYGKWMKMAHLVC